MRFTRDLSRMHDTVAARYVFRARICLGIAIFFAVILVAALCLARS
jgi:hypothetical protein